MNVLVVNAGSSSLKLRLLDAADRVQGSADLPPIRVGEIGEELGRFVSAGPAADAVGHRVVHGGADYRQAVRLDKDVDAQLDRLADLAPLHNARSLAAIRALQELCPDIPQIACFDTAFHATLPPEAATYAVPWEWTRRWGLRRYGFHGLSHAWASRRAAELMGRPISDLRLVTAHLGSGASVAAVAEGRSVDTTMGFTPLEGLVMATRSGTVDPGLLLWLQHHGGLSVEAVERGLDNESGLLGVSGSSDLRVVIDGVDEGDERARLAYGIYLHRLRGLVATMAAAMNGLDGLVFTGGAGEGSARLRRDACTGLGFVGVALDDRINAEDTGDRLLSGTNAPVVVAVVAAREDIEIAHQVRQVLSRRSS
ncbi:MAG TPA: acetate/propionate family kinase [Acidimicrobiales bacterium]|nr:acetate/propionate family kinase [Acidimicrobiales bacterium]